MIINDTAFLCGYFSCKQTAATELFASRSETWTAVQYSERELNEAKNFYYPEFADLHMSKVKTFSHKVDRDIPLTFRDGSSHTVRIQELQAYIFPFGIIQYSIRVSQAGQEVQNVLDALFMMRNICTLPQDAAGEYVKYALAPLSEICEAAGNSGEFHALMECGNKLKIFHTIECQEKPEGEFSFDNLLYGGGTLSVFKSGAPMGFSDEYYKSILSGNKLSIFNNWEALALLDTFTIVTYETKEYLLELWNKEYFEKLYLHSLFRKFFLFRINGDFRSESRSIAQIRKDLSLFENEYTFPRKSYNFLPEELSRSMEKGLDIDDEIKKVAEIIDKENARREAETGDKMNLFLGVITCLTLFSAIWDFACLMDGVFEFSSNIGTATGIRACTMVLIAAICLIAIFVKRK